MRSETRRKAAAGATGAGRGSSRLSWTLLVAALLSTVFLVLYSLPTAHSWPSGLPGGVVGEAVASIGDYVSDFVWLSENKLIIAGKRGRLILFIDGRWTATLLDISWKIGTNGDRGLMCITMDPQFYRGRPYIYVGYTVDPNRNGGMNYNMISRFTYVNDRLTDEVLLFGGNCNLDGSFNYNGNCAPMAGTTHSIGTLWFNNDGALWVSIGEGNIHDGDFWAGLYGYVGTDRALGMDLNFLGGKILRINPDNGAGYGDNPFCDGPVWSAACKVWATGLRNPFRCTGGPAAVRCGDVGWYTIESYKILYRGQNSGWPCYEGTTIPPGFNPASGICSRIYNGDNPYPGISTGVLWQWNHNGGSAAAIGGVQIPSYYPEVGGRWIVADYTSGTVWALAGGDVQTFFTGADNPVSFKVGTDGWLYYLSNFEGTVFRLRIRGFNPPPNPTVPRMTTAKPIPTTSKRPPDPMCDNRRIKVPDCAVPDGGQPMAPMSYISREGFPASRIRYNANGGWGPVGLDSSVGKKGVTNSGRSLGSGGVWYVTGFGTHAVSNIGLTTGKCCYRFTASVGVDDEIKKIWPQWYNLSAGGEFTVRSIDTNGVLWNSAKARPWTKIKYGTTPINVDVRNLHLHNKIALEATMPAGTPMTQINWRPAHLDWAEAKLYCGPTSPYAPIINMTSPPLGYIAQPNEVVKFAATVLYWDNKTPVPPQFWRWDINLVHCQGALCHQHNPYQFKGVASGVFTAVPHDDSKAQYYFYSVQLKVVDRCGFTDMTRRSVPMAGFLDKP